MGGCEDRIRLLRAYNVETDHSRTISEDHTRGRVWVLCQPYGVHWVDRGRGGSCPYGA